LKQEEDEEK